MEDQEPPKAAWFAWLVCRRACLTHEVLHKRGWQISSRCVMCEQEAKVNDHLFLHCKTTMNLWNMFLAMLGVNWWMPGTTKELLNSWIGIGNRQKEGHWWTTIPACIWWTLWKERNSRYFEGQKSNLHRIRMNSTSLLFFWFKGSLLGETVHLVDFIGNL